MVLIRVVIVVLRNCVRLRYIGNWFVLRMSFLMCCLLVLIGILMVVLFDYFFIEECFVERWEY